MKRALGKIPSYLNMRGLVITEEYKEGFLRAEATFKHMICFDPKKRCLTRLTPVDENLDEKLLENAGEIFDDDVAFQLALGNINPRSMKKVDNWHPDYSNIKIDPKFKTSSHVSIWKGHVQKPTIQQSTLKEKKKTISLIQQITEDYSEKLEEKEIARLE